MRGVRGVSMAICVASQEVEVFVYASPYALREFAPVVIEGISSRPRVADPKFVIRDGGDGEWVSGYFIY